jgi:hypothetical protein
MYILPLDTGQGRKNARHSLTFTISLKKVGYTLTLKSPQNFPKETDKSTKKIKT